MKARYYGLENEWEWKDLDIEERLRLLRQAILDILEELKSLDKMSK